MMSKVQSSKELQSAKPAMEPESVSAATPVTTRGSKLKMSIEKKIENIWLESEQLGWSYNDFVSHLIEVLIILNYRTSQPKLNSDHTPLKKDGNGSLIDAVRSLPVN